MKFQVIARNGRIYIICIKSSNHHRVGILAIVDDQVFRRWCRGDARQRLQPAVG